MLSKRNLSNIFKIIKWPWSSRNHTINNYFKMQNIKMQGTQNINDVIAYFFVYIADELWFKKEGTAIDKNKNKKNDWNLEKKY